MLVTNLNFFLVSFYFIAFVDKNMNIVLTFLSFEQGR